MRPSCCLPLSDIDSDSGSRRVRELAERAAQLARAGSLWPAYVALERAILELKMRRGLEGEPMPPAPKRNAEKAGLVEAALASLAQLDYGGDGKKLLYGLRTCRNMLKAAVAKS